MIYFLRRFLRVNLRSRKGFKTCKSEGLLCSKCNEELLNSTEKSFTESPPPARSAAAKIPKETQALQTIFCFMHKKGAPRSSFFKTILST